MDLENPWIDTEMNIPQRNKLDAKKLIFSHLPAGRQAPLEDLMYALIFLSSKPSDMSAVHSYCSMAVFRRGTKFIIC
jgi:hypothetical protein